MMANISVSFVCWSELVFVSLTHPTFESYSNKSVRASLFFKKNPKILRITSFFSSSNLASVVYNLGNPEHFVDRSIPYHKLSIFFLPLPSVANLVEFVPSVVRRILELLSSCCGSYPVLFLCG